MEGGLLQVGRFQDPLLVSCANQSLQKLLKRQMEDLLRGGSSIPDPSLINTSSSTFTTHISSTQQKGGRKEGWRGGWSGGGRGFSNSEKGLLSLRKEETGLCWQTVRSFWFTLYKSFPVIWGLLDKNYLECVSFSLSLGSINGEIGASGRKGVSEEAVWAGHLDIATIWGLEADCGPSLGTSDKDLVL